MPDTFQKKKRSEIMALVRSAGNKTTELAMIALFKKQGIHGWRRNALLFGKPDFIFRKERLAIFVDGCFWHGCPLHGSLPGSNAEYWQKKIVCNKRRACAVNTFLTSKKWTVIRIWEHELILKRTGALVERLKRLGLKPNRIGG
jgi:DNA mismatch endonuclease (patch repair protein)